MSLKKLNAERGCSLFDSEKAEHEKKPTFLLYIPVFIVLASLLSMVVLGAVAVNVLVSTTSTSTTTSTLPEPTTTTTTTSTLPPTTTSTTTTTATTTTSTTLPVCGGVAEFPCDSGCDPGLTSGEMGLCFACGSAGGVPCEDGCDAGFVMNSYGFCQSADCVPSISSGRDGCGGWALDYCV